MNPFNNIARLTGLAMAAAALMIIVLPALGGDDPQPGAGPFNLTIFHTNDAHGHFLPRPAVWRDDGKMVGGAVPLAWHLEQQRQDTSADLFLDAGDFMTGNPVCLIAPEGVPGVAMARMMSLLGYDAGTIGNHEFDVGAEDLKKLIPYFQYPLIAADILDEAGQPAFRAEPLVVQKGDLRVGILGVSCAGMSEVVTTSRFRGLKSGDQAEIVRRQAAQLDDQTDLMILITHNGSDNDVDLARQLVGSGIDVIVGGHSHSRLKKPRLESGILVVQAGSKWSDLGRLDLQVENDRVVAYNGRLITLWAEGTTAGDELSKLVSYYEQEVIEKYGRQLGTLTTDLRKGRGESNLGNFLADQMRQVAGTNVALINSGGIRKSLKAGPVTALDINEVLPFSNLLVTCELSGDQLQQVVQANADAQVGGEHGILQVSGLSYRFRADPSGKKATLEEILVLGKPLQANSVYTVAMPDYVVMMAHVYLKIPAPATQDVGVTLTEAVVRAVSESGPIDSQIEGRIMRLDAPKGE